LKQNKEKEEVKKMTVFSVGTYLVKREKRQEFLSFQQRWLKYVKDNPETFKELKSWKLFSQEIGGTLGGYVEMWEFDNLTEYAKSREKRHSDKGYVEFAEEWYRLTEPSTWNIWNAVM
jgi:hypothetical protein